MFNKERLLKIINLNISASIEAMDEDAYAEYSNNLNSFIAEFPAAEEKIKTALSGAEDIDCRDSLILIGELLTNISADILAAECTRISDNLSVNEHEKNVAYLTNFLAAVSALSIDIQMSIIPTERKEPSNNEPTPTSAGNRILAVDDVTFFLSTLKSMLKDTSAKLICVTSGDAALRFLSEHEPDLFLLDIDMPGMNGYELALKIKERGHKAPIIFLTGNAKRSYVLKAIEVGAADFVIKPINKEQLLEKIGKYVTITPLEEDVNE